MAGPTGKSAKTNTKFCVGKDAFERMNYLYQLSNSCASGQIAGTAQAARFYVHQVVAISKKTVQRISPSIKRTICKRCHEFLIPGKTCKIRVKKKVVIHKCLLCSTEKRFLSTPNYVLWNERPEAVAELLDYRDNEEQVTDNKQKSDKSEVKTTKDVKNKMAE